MITPKEAHEVAKAHGFWVTKPNIGEKLMLIVSEVSEALEAHRKYDWNNFEEELADVVIRVFDLAEGLKLDLEKAIQRKHEINKVRPYLHGKAY